MSKIGGYTFSGTPNDQWKYVNTKVVSSGATALITSLEDVNVTLSAGEINVSAFKNAAGTPKDAIVNANDILYNIISNADATASALPVAGNSVGVADVALPVADANVLTALSAVAIPTTIVGGTKDVTTAGTREALGASTTIKSVTIRAKAANGGNIYVGGVTVDSANGIALAANDSVELDIANLATVYVDSSIDGEGVGFTYFN